MRTVDYNLVLQQAAELAGDEYSRLGAEAKRRWRGFISRRLREAWEDAYWPETMKVEERHYRQDWASGTSYTPGDEVFYLGTLKYYVCTKATSSVAPADANEDPNYSNWYPSQRSYSGSDYAAATAYVAGDVAYYPTTDTYYACHTASTGNLPSDTSYWGALTVFDPYVSYTQSGKTEIGMVRDVYNKNPRTHRDWASPEFELNENGVQVPSGIAKVWIEFQQRAPVIQGDEYAAATAYAIGDHVQYTNGSVINFYKCTAASTGNLPTDTSYWERINIPYIFLTYLTFAAYADWLRHDGQDDIAARYERRASTALQSEQIKASQLQPVTNRIEVQTY